MAKLHIIMGKLHLKLTNNALRDLYAYQAIIYQVNYFNRLSMLPKIRYNQKLFKRYVLTTLFLY